MPAPVTTPEPPGTRRFPHPFALLAGWIVLAAVLTMMGTHVAVHVPVPGVSSQAVLTMPIPAPTNGALMAVLAAAGVPFDRWFRFTAPLFLLLLALGAGAITLGIAIGLE